MDPKTEFDIYNDGTELVALCDDWSTWVGPTLFLISQVVTWGVVVLNLVVRFIFIALGEFLPAFTSETEKYDFIRHYVYWAVWF
jgi:hypothetical protein